MSFFDFDGSPDKISDFSFSFGGESEAKPNRNQEPSAFDFGWDDNEAELRAKEPSPRTARTTPAKSANPSPKLKPNRNELKSKSHQVKNTDQPVNKMPRISPTKRSNGQRPSVHHGASANAKTSTTPSPIKVSENKVLVNQNLQSHDSRKPNDVQTMSEDDNQNLPDVKESLKKSDVLGLDQVLKQSLESLDAKVASLAPALKKQEDDDAEILGKASLLLSEIRQYRESLEETKHHFSSRLNQVASFLKKQ